MKAGFKWKVMLLICSLGWPWMHTLAQPNITAVEYFFNTDPGPGNGTAISITPGTTIDLTNIDIPTTSLAIGWHTVHVRARDANNVWGFYESRRIYVRGIPEPDITPPPSPISAMEFYYDIDNGPGTGSPISITTDLTVDLTNIELANNLPVGWHTVSVRAKNQANVWSMPETRRIYVREPSNGGPPPPSNIVQFEYFIDNDPGVGLAPLTLTKPPTQLIDLVDEPLNIGTVAVGAHKIGLRAKNALGEWSMTEVRDFNVTAPCAIIVAATATGTVLCSPGQVTLTASGAEAGETYRWYANETTLTTLFTGNPFITPTLAINTTYYVTRYNPTTFCESVRIPVTATVEGLIAPVLNLTGSLAVCEGNSVTLIAPAGFSTYTWRNGVVDLGLNTNQITVNTTGVFTLTVGNGLCTSPPSTDFTFTINPKPAKPTINSTSGGSLCATGTVTLTAPAGFAQYLWSGGQTTESIDVTSIGSHTVRVTSAAGCQSDLSDPVAVISSSPVKPVITITGNTVLCGSSTVTLTVPTGFSNYTWRRGVNNLGLNQNEITVSTIGDYTVVVSDGACVSPASDLVAVSSVSVPGKPTITALNSTALCVGSFVALQAPAGFTNYTWSNGETSRQIIVTTAGSYTVQVGNALTCLSVASDALVVTETGQSCTGTSGPIANNVERCGSGIVNLTATGATGNQVYRWYDAPTGGTLLFTGSPYTPTIANTTAYYVSFFDTGTSIESARTAMTATVVLVATPSISPAGPISICEGSTTLLAAPTGFTDYLWSTGAVTQQIVVNSTDNFTVQTKVGACLSAASSPVSVTVSPALTKPVITVVGNTTFCGSGSAQLNAPTGFSNYLWSTGAITASINVTTAGNYTVTVGNGICTSPASDAINITSVSIPAKPTVTITGNTALCSGAFVGLAAPNGFNFYLWSNGATSQQIIVTSAGSYSVQVSNAGSCLSVASDIVSVTETGQSCGGAATPEANFVATTVCQGQPTAFSDLSINLGTGATYEWDFDNDGTTDNTTAGSVTHTYSGSGSFTAALKITLSGGTVVSRNRTIQVNAVPQISVTTNTVCLGFATTFTDNSTEVLPGAVYSWDFNNDGTQDNTTAGNTTHVYPNSGSFTAVLRIDNGNGCISQQAFNVSVNRTPVIPFVEIEGGASPQLCAGNSIKLVVPAESGASYQWQRNTVDVGTNLPELTASTSGTYRLSITNVCGTISALNTITTLSVPSPTAATIAVSGSASLCEGESALLSIPFANGIQYQWKLNGTEIPDANANLFLATLGGSYSVVSSSSCGSLESNAQVISTLPPAPPSVAIDQTGNLTVCSGEEVELFVTSIPNVTYQWRRNGVDLALNQNSILVGQSGTYTIQLSNACRTVPGNNSVQVVVNQKPLAQLISANRAPVICPGEEVQLNVIPEAGVTYQWLRDDQLIAGAVASQYNAGESGTYSLKLNNSCGEIISSNTIGISVIATPAQPTITADGEITICENQTVVLRIPALAGVSYSWSRNAVTIPFTNSNTLVAAQAGTYRVSVNNGCTEVTSSNAIEVTLLPKAPLAQTIVASGSTTFCLSQQVELSVPTETGVNYLWKVNGIAVGENKNTLVAVASGVYSVELFNDCRMVGSINVITVTVLDRPLEQNIQTNRPSDLCEGESIELSVPLEADVTYQWSRNGVVVPGELSTTLSTSLSGEYQVTMSNACGTRFSGIRQVNVQAPPSPVTISANGPLSFCEGESVILSVPFISGQIYSWKRDGNNLGNSFQVLAQQSGKYTVQVGNLCFANYQTDTVTVTQFASPPRPTIASVLLDNCDKRTYELTAQGAFVNYQWFIGTSKLVATNAQKYNPVVTGVYKVRATDINGCSSESEPVSVEVSTLRTPGIEGQGNPDSLLVADVVAESYQWYVNNRYIVGATNRQLQVFYNGEYRVRVTYTDGCRVFSIGYPLNEESYNKYGRQALFPNDSSIVLPERKFDDLIEVTPNPAKELVTINYFGSPTNNTTCSLISLVGVRVLHGTMIRKKGYLQIEFDLTDLDQGVYIVKIQNQFTVVSKKLIKI